MLKSGRSTTRSDEPVSTPAPRRVTQAERTRDARARIIDATCACLAEDGYQHTTMIEIAKRADCSRELPRYHFGTRDLLMEAVISDVQSHWRAIFDGLQTSDMTALEVLYQTADLIAKEMTENTAKVRGFVVLVFCAADPANKVLHAQVLANQNHTRAYFRTMVVRHMQENPERKTLDADAIASLIYGMFRGMGYQWLIDPDGVSIAALMSEFKRTLPILLGAGQAPAAAR